jgi:predicted lactoylglutathione lyase
LTFASENSVTRPSFIDSFSRPLVSQNNGKEKSGEAIQLLEPVPSKAFFGFTEDPNHQPNSIRIAFWVNSSAEVDRVPEIIQQAGAKNIEGPFFNPEYDETYYAVFFDDPSGNRLEVVYRQK